MAYLKQWPLYTAKIDEVRSIVVLQLSLEDAGKLWSRRQDLSAINMARCKAMHLAVLLLRMLVVQTHRRPSPPPASTKHEICPPSIKEQDEPEIAMCW